MFSKEFQKFIQKQSEYLSKTYGSLDVEKNLLAQTVKLGEEAGEVADAVLARLGDQRKEKLKDSRDLGSELADVIIVCSIIAETAGIDITEAVRDKMEKIVKRRK